MNKKIEIDTDDLWVLLKCIDTKQITLDFDWLTATMRPLTIERRWWTKPLVITNEQVYLRLRNILLKSGWCVVEENNG